MIIPIRKPGKDASNPVNYRPIARTSNIRKIMERLIMEMLTFCIENRGIPSPHQSCFRLGRGTMDPFMCVETGIKSTSYYRIFNGSFL